ncbi:unnamed protein product [Rhizophagus irregularis]|nr:unnamed protein product [Rhizophagus irregularis]
MRLDEGLHEEDSDNDENDPVLILRLISLRVQYNNDLPYVRKYLLFHQARYEPYINTPFWNTLSLPTQNFISKVYSEKKDIQFTPYKRSTTNYPVIPISSSLDSLVDDLFESSLPADLSSHDVDHLDSSHENAGSSDIFSSDIVSPAINWDTYLDPDVDEADSIEEDRLMDEFMERLYAECSLPPVSSYFSRSPSPVPVFLDNTSLVFLSDSDDELMDLDDDSLFLAFDEETLTYYETEWLELIFRPVCFSYIPFYIRPPSFDLDLSIISSRRLPAPLPPPSFLDQRVISGRQMFWKIFVRFVGLGKFLVVPSLSTADFKFYNKIFCSHPSIYDQITRFACLFEIFTGLLLLICIRLPAETKKEIPKGFGQSNQMLEMPKLGRNSVLILAKIKIRPKL